MDVNLLMKETKSDTFLKDVSIDEMIQQICERKVGARLIRVNTPLENCTPNEIPSPTNNPSVRQKLPNIDNDDGPCFEDEDDGKMQFTKYLTRKLKRVFKEHAEQERLRMIEERENSKSHMTQQHWRSSHK